MNYNEKHIKTLKETFKFTDREARFVWIVANATGYFLGKHIDLFFNIKMGKSRDKFIKKLQRKRLIKEFSFANRTRVYHLISRRLYALLEQENSRLRKAHENIYIAKRLLLLSFIIENIDKNFLFTEQEKVKFFSEKFGISKEFLPYKIYVSNKTKNETIRYFVDRTPIIISQNSLSHHFVVSFIYLHSALNTSLSDFTTWLNLYQKLFYKLPTFNLIFLSTSNSFFEKAEGKFFKFLGKDKEETTSYEIKLIEEVKRYFELREAREEKNYKVFQGKNATWFFDNETKFKNDFIENLFKEWKENGRKEEIILNKFDVKNDLKIEQNNVNFIPYYQGKIDEIFQYSY